jgi:iron-sulfur cluster assembly protein
MLTLTPEAVRAVVDVVAAQDASPDAGLRIASGPPTTFEQTWDYAVQPQPFDGDVVVEDGPARVFIDADAAPQLEHAVLDAHVDEDTADVRFLIRRAGG